MKKTVNGGLLLLLGLVLGFLLSRSLPIVGHSETKLISGKGISVPARTDDGGGKASLVGNEPAAKSTREFPAPSEAKIYAPNSLQLANLKKLNSQASAMVAREYDDYFSGLGLAPDNANRLKARITEVLQSKNEIFLAFEMLSVATYDLKEDIRRELGEEKYDEYIKWENGSRARREMDSLARFAETAGIAMSQADMALVAGFIESEEAYSTTTLRPPFVSPHPFEPMATPFRDRPAEIAERYRKEAVTLRNQAAAVAKLLQEAGAGNELLSIVSSYYGEKLSAQDKRTSMLQERAAIPTVPRVGPISSLPSPKMMEVLNAQAAQREKELRAEEVAPR